MNPKLKVPQPPDHLAPTRPKRKIRRQLDANLVTGPGPGLLLSHEDPAILENLRQSVRDRLNCKSTLDLVFAELATSNAWRALRNVKLECASIDTEIADQSEAVDREYEEIDDVSRTALIYNNAEVNRVLRTFRQSQTECQRSLLQIVRPPSGRTGA